METHVKIAYIDKSKQHKHNSKLTKENTSFGTGFSGFNNQNEKVMGFVHNEILSDTVLSDPNLLWPVPTHWSLQKASTVPGPYVYAYYCLVVRGNISKDMTIFITNSAGAVGQALLSISLALGCTVYTIVNTEEKKKMLLKTFLMLQENNVIVSTDDNFYTKIIDMTKNNCCDLVIYNCENTNTRKDAMKCVATNGKFVDLSKNDMEENNSIGMSFFGKSNQYVSLRLCSIFKSENQNEREIIWKHILEGISSNIVKPFTKALYDHNDEETGKDKDISNIKVKNSKHLNVSKANHIKKSKIGLDVFHSYIEIDDYEATEIINIMETQISNTSFEFDEEMNYPNETYLLMIPGFEGHHRVFKTICKRIKIQAVSIQLGPNSKAEGIKDIAENIIQDLQKMFKPKSKFYILGYSFGVNVAFELAALLEIKGCKGVIFCIDSSPDALKLQLDAYLGKLTDNDIQNSVIRHVYKLLTGHDDAELDTFICKTDDWVEKINRSLMKLKQEVRLSHEYIKDIMNSLYNKIIISKEYDPDYKLESKLVLIKGKQELGNISIPYDYGLSKYSKQQVRVFNIEANHVSVPEDCRVPNIVNKILDSELMDDLKKSTSV